MMGENGGWGEEGFELEKDIFNFLLFSLAWEVLCCLEGVYPFYFIFIFYKKQGEILSLIGVISHALKMGQLKQKSVANCWGSG